MKFFHIFLVVGLSVITTVATVSYIGPKSGPAGVNTSARESAYDHVLNTGVLRCGYADWPPYVFTKDPTSGKFSGIDFEIMEAIAAKLKLKIEWAENLGWGTLVESLRDHRVDAFCTGVWSNAERGRYLGFTAPMFFSAVYPYVAEDDHRFDKDLSSVNSPDVRISVMDGETSDVIAKQRFPKATAVSVPQLGQVTDILVNVATHKADIVFNEPSFADDFIKANPGKIRRAQDIPLQVFPTVFAVDIHETQLLDMLNSALTELQNAGVIDTIIAKYNSDPHVFLRVAKPYNN